MTDKEKLEAIRAEIHRLVDVRGYDRGMANDLFAFMDSLPNEPVSEDLEEAVNAYIGYPPEVDESSSTYGKRQAFKAGVKWQKEQINEALLSEVLPCFMHGGEADEVVAKLDEVLNQKK